MDNSVEPVTGGRGHRWSTPVAVVVAAWLGAGGALGWCVLGPADPAGRLLIGITALALTGAALYGTRARPRLAADETGVWITGLRGTARYPWTAVQRSRVLRTRRLGRDVPTLELETVDPAGGTERLHVFSRLELGADPADVAGTLADLRAR